MLRGMLNIFEFSDGKELVLRRIGLKAKHKLKKPAISAVNKRKRLEFAKRHEHWTKAD